jgi:hypothetical protein
VLERQPCAGDVQQGDRQGVRDHVVQFAGDAVAFLRPRPLRQPRLGRPQLRDQVTLVPDQQAAEDGERDARHPRAPAGVGLDPQPFDGEQGYRAGAVHQAVAASADQHAPRAEQAYREPADVPG